MNPAAPAPAVLPAIGRHRSRIPQSKQPGSGGNEQAASYGAARMVLATVRANMAKLLGPRVTQLILRCLYEV